MTENDSLRIGVTELEDKFDWRAKKKLAKKHVELVRQIIAATPADDIQRREKWQKYLAKIQYCGNHLEYLSDGSGQRRTLYRAMLCKDRFCPICSARRARAQAVKLKKIALKVNEDHPGVGFVFLTLTVKNCVAEDLKKTISKMTAAWSRLVKRTAFKNAFHGLFRVLEITYNKKSHSFHPHFHAILAVDPEYFTDPKLYLDQRILAEFWQQSMRIDYTPITYIETTYDRARKNESAIDAAVVEAAKYCVKGNDFLAENLCFEEKAKVFETLYDAIYKRQLFALSGWFTDAARAVRADLADDGDLIHGDENAAPQLTPKTAPFIELYKWRRKTETYVLADILHNPEYDPFFVHESASAVNARRVDPLVPLFKGHVIIAMKKRSTVEKIQRRTQEWLQGS